MGFIKSVGKFAGKVVLGAAEMAVDALLDANKKATNAQRRASNQSDRNVVNNLKNATGAEKIGYAKELEKRGYLKQEGSTFKKTGKKMD